MKRNEHNTLLDLVLCVDSVLAGAQHEINKMANATVVSDIQIFVYSDIVTHVRRMTELSLLNEN